METRERILIFTPTAPTGIEPETRDAVLGQDYSGYWDWMVTRDNPYGDSYVNVQIAYAKMKRIALSEGYSRVWIVEADTIPPRDALTKLCEVDADLVTGLYPFRHGDECPNLMGYGIGPEFHSAITWETVKQAKSPLMRVSGGCMGCVLVRPIALDFDFMTGDEKAPDIPWMTHNWKRGRVTMARLDVKCGHKTAEGRILWSEDYIK